MLRVNEKNLAKAIYEIAKEKDNKTVVDDLKLMSKMIKEVSQLKNLLLATADINKVENFLQDNFKQVNKFSIKALLIIVKYKYLKSLDKVINLIEQAKSIDTGSQKAVVQSVIKLSGKQSEKLQTVLKEKLKMPIEIENIINKKIKGGLKIKINDILIDASVSGKINQLNKNLF
jgi:F-type H+-transporting ATPase subunit delta